MLLIIYTTTWENVELPLVDRFKYLASYVSRDCMMNEEIHERIQSASCAHLAVLEKECLTAENWQLKPKLKCTTNV